MPDYYEMVIIALWHILALASTGTAYSSDLLEDWQGEWGSWRIEGKSEGGGYIRIHCLPGGRNCQIDFQSKKFGPASKDRCGIWRREFKPLSESAALIEASNSCKLKVARDTSKSSPELNAEFIGKGCSDLCIGPVFFAKNYPLKSKLPFLPRAVNECYARSSKSHAIWCTDEDFIGLDSVTYAKLTDKYKAWESTMHEKCSKASDVRSCLISTYESELGPQPTYLGRFKKTEIRKHLFPRVDIRADLLPGLDALPGRTPQLPGFKVKEVAFFSEYIKLIEPDFAPDSLVAAYEFFVTAQKEGSSVADKNGYGICRLSATGGKLKTDDCLNVFPENGAANIVYDKASFKITEKERAYAFRLNVSGSENEDLLALRFVDGKWSEVFNEHVTEVYEPQIKEAGCATRMLLTVLPSKTLQMFDWKLSPKKSKNSENCSDGIDSTTRVYRWNGSRYESHASHD